MVEELTAENNPENPQMGSRQIPFSRTLYIEQEDFMEQPPGKFFRLAPGREDLVYWRDRRESRE